MDKGYISVGWGLSYVMKGVTLSPPSPDLPVHLDEVVVSPSILPALIGRMGGSLAVYNGGGKITDRFPLRKAHSSRLLSALKTSISAKRASSNSALESRSSPFPNGSLNGKDLSIQDCRRPGPARLHQTNARARPSWASIFHGSRFLRLPSRSSTSIRARYKLKPSSSAKILTTISRRRFR